MDPYADPAVRHALHAALIERDSLRALLAGCEGEGDADTARYYAALLDKLEHVIDQWPDSVLPRHRVEG